MACLLIHVSEEAPPSALNKTRIEDTPRVSSTRSTSYILGFIHENFGGFLLKPNTQVAYDAAVPCRIARLFFLALMCSREEIRFYH